MNEQIKNGDTEVKVFVTDNTAYVDMPEEVIVPTTTTEATATTETTQTPTTSDTPTIQEKNKQADSDDIFVDVVYPEHNYNQVGDISATDIDSNLSTFILPSVPDDIVEKHIEQLPNLDLGTDEKTNKWRNTVLGSFSYAVPSKSFYSSLARPGSFWENSIKHEGCDLRAGIPRFTAKSASKDVGERAILTAMQHVGLGSLFITPLWHSGFWITFKPAPDIVLLEFYRLIMSDKINIGRDTKGLVFSNLSAIIIDRCFDLIIPNYIYSTTLAPEVTNKYSLRELISSLDIESFLWGFVCSNYPRGFNYQRPCINNPHKCKHVTEARLNIAKLQWTDSSVLTVAQRAHMTNRQQYVMTYDAIEKYKNDLVRIVKRRNAYFEGSEREFFITFKVPNCAEYTEAGHRWIGSITDMVTEALGKESTAKERSATMENNVKASLMMRYVHWIDSIEINDNIIDDRETIEKQISNVFSAIDEISEKFTEDVLKYIDDVTISIIGIPGYDCPVCNAPQEGEAKTGRYRYIIPLDMVQLFFDHINQRIARVTSR